MKNTDYIIYMTTKRGRRWKYYRDKNAWRQVGPEGQTHRMTAEQVLNHLLPPLSGIKSLRVEVIYTPTSTKGKAPDPR
jgi:hypothetical protein